MTTLAEIVEGFFDHRTFTMHVACPGFIESYDFASQKASVKIAQKLLYDTGDDLDSPIVSGVPVIFPASGGASLTFPIKKGDTVLLIFADKSIEDWLSKGDVRKPTDARRFDINDAIAIPGLMPFTKKSGAENNEDVLLSFDSKKVRLKNGGGIEMESDANGVSILGKLTVSKGIEAKEDIKSTNGDVLAAAISLTHHKHGNVQTGAGQTGEPV